MTVWLAGIGRRIMIGCRVVREAPDLGVDEESLEVEMPDGPGSQHQETNDPADDDVARQRLCERVPVKLERY